MKKILSGILAISIAACNNNDNKNMQHPNDMNKMNNDSTQPAAVTKSDKEIKAVTVTYTNLDAKAAAVVKEIIDHYLHVKNALANDDGSEAASAAKAMDNAISKMDNSLLTAEQKKVYDDIADDLKEHAEHIGKNGDKISHQREHFSMMSEDVYDLVKAFGAGRAIYQDHCPMYNENKGAIWLSEIKEVKNPYLGSKMLSCGTVEEVIK